MGLNNQVVENVGSNLKFALIRRDPHTMFQDLKPWIEKQLVGCKEVVNMCMTSDNGNLTIAVIYRVQTVDQK